MTDFVADCVTDTYIFFFLQVGGEIVWCDICFSFHLTKNGKPFAFLKILISRLHYI